MTRTSPRPRRQIANPVLGLPAARAQHSWAQNKGIMAAYWKAVSVYARHIRRVLVAGERYEAGRRRRVLGAARQMPPAA